MDKNKRFVVLNTFLTFAISFLVHNIYHWLPNVVTTIFPVNESLFEHMKLIYLSPIISSLILYCYFRKNGYFINNYWFGLIVSTIFNIIIFYLIYLPLYYQYGQSMVMTLSVYFITIVIADYLYYLIIAMNNSTLLNRISIIMIIIIGSILVYFTYHPIKIDFFFDPIHRYYGIKKK